jgi:4-amino-4-deoxy-L-arabinose transferase-like glycosyltransferase
LGYFVFFTLSATKLPNYILPVYPPLALLTGRFIEVWRLDRDKLGQSQLRLGLCLLALAGVGLAVALLALGGVISIRSLHDRVLADLAPLAILGLVPVLGSILALISLQREQRTGVVICLSATGALLLASISSWASVTVDAHKAPRPLVEAVKPDWAGADVRIACYDYYQPSLVFYSQREVLRLDTESRALEFLRSPLPSYLFVSTAAWDKLRPRATATAHILARHRDLYRNCEVAVVCNH